MSLALIDILCTIPIGIYLIYLELAGVHFQPYIFWSSVHFDFGHVLLVPSITWRSVLSILIAVKLDRWVLVSCAFVFFALFGFAQEATKNYQRVFWFVARRLGLRKKEARARGKVLRLPGMSPSFSLSYLCAYMFAVLLRLKNLKLKSDKEDSIPVYAAPVNPTIPSVLCKGIRKSILDADSRSTICFLDDDKVELGPYRKSYSESRAMYGSSSDGCPLSPTSTPRTPITPTHPHCTPDAEP